MSMLTNNIQRLTFVMVICLLALPSVVSAESPAVTVEVGAITKPSVHAKLGLPQFGTVLELPVKEGQQVKKGDILLKQDNRQEQAILTALEMEANSTVRVEAADADLKVKTVQLERFKELEKSGSSNPMEIEEAQVKVVYADAQAKIAKLELDKNQEDFKRQQAKVDQMTLKSPVDGFVETIDVTVGETTDPQKPILTVVQNDPMWIEFYLPVAQAAKLKVGQSLEVRSLSDKETAPATLIFKAPMADAQSDTQKVRLEMKNPTGRDTGMQVLVKLPPDVAPSAQDNPPAAALAPMGRP